jgi:selenophosphate synthetase-related protein
MARAIDVAVSGDELIVRLKDGRTVSAPLNWYPRLFNATPEQRANFELMGDGEGIHWPDADEDLSVAGILRGVRSPGA